MSRLLSPLETLSQKHPDVVVQELASNLRAVIATHGAYRPENFTAATAQGSKDSETKPKNNDVPLKKKKKQKTQANDSQASPPSPPLGTDTPSNTYTRHPASSGGSAAGTSPKGGGRSSGSTDPSPPTKTFSDWVLEACDPDVPTRAFALRTLTRMVQNRDPEAVQAQEKVLIVSCLLTYLNVFLLLFKHLVSNDALS